MTIFLKTLYICVIAARDNLNNTSFVKWFVTE